jgi:hypothetical protein
MNKSVTTIVFTRSVIIIIIIISNAITNVLTRSVIVINVIRISVNITR